MELDSPHSAVGHAANWAGNASIAGNSGSDNQEAVRKMSLLQEELLTKFKCHPPIDLEDERAYSKEKMVRILEAAEFMATRGAVLPLSFHKVRLWLAAGGDIAGPLSDLENAIDSINA
jgi:hypothetical protein